MFCKTILKSTLSNSKPSLILIRTNTFSFKKFLETENLIGRKNLNNYYFESRRFLFDKFLKSLGQSQSEMLRHEEKHHIGYSQEQMYNIVSNVEEYKKFVPWCTGSQVIKSEKNSEQYKCLLTVGFPPLVEKYNSLVTAKKPVSVRSVCIDGHLFHHLDSLWTFSPGLDPNNKNTCVVHFFVEFQFRYTLHSHLAQVFFDEVIKKMVKAFFKRAQLKYGDQVITPHRIPLHNSSS